MGNIFTEFREKLEKYGLEYFRKYYGIYRGTCFDNKDPEFLGRIRVQCPDIYGDDSPEIWATPKGNPAGKGFGLLAMPSPGDRVWVMFEGGNPRFPIWEHGWWESGQTPETAKRETPDNYVFQSPSGHRIEMDDKNKYIKITSKDGSSILLSDADEQIDIESKAGFKVSVMKDGIMIGKGPNNLFDFLTELFTLFEQTTVSTPIIGPQPFLNLPAYIALKEKLQLFLKS